MAKDKFYKEQRAKAVASLFVSIVRSQPIWRAERDISDFIISNFYNCLGEGNDIKY